MSVVVCSSFFVPFLYFSKKNGVLEYKEQVLLHSNNKHARDLGVDDVITPATNTFFSPSCIWSYAKHVRFIFYLKTFARERNLKKEKMVVVFIPTARCLTSRRSFD